MLLNEEVKFSVSDTGIGIPKEEMENIFSRFYRIKNEINDVTSGSGIGLPIAQHYIQLLEGNFMLNQNQAKVAPYGFPFRSGKVRVT
jgi:signal transduction histidine kinase